MLLAATSPLSTPSLFILQGMIETRLFDDICNACCNGQSIHPLKVSRGSSLYLSMGFAEAVATAWES